jgi:hypothetical protein
MDPYPIVDIRDPSCGRQVFEIRLHMQGERSTLAASWSTSAPEDGDDKRWFGSGGSARTGSGRATKVLAGIVVAVVTAFAVAIATGAGEATWKWIGGLWAGPEPTESQNRSWSGRTPETRNAVAIASMHAGANRAIEGILCRPSNGLHGLWRALTRPGRHDRLQREPLGS